MNIAIVGILMDAFFIILLLWCGYSDIRKRTVPNLAIALLLCMGLVHTTLLLLTGNTWCQYPAGLLLAIPFFTAWLKNGMGAGDVKLIAAIALYLGLFNTLVSLALMIPFLAVLMVWSWCGHKTLKSRIPLAPVIGVGAIGVVLLGYFLKLVHH